MHPSKQPLCLKINTGWRFYYDDVPCDKKCLLIIQDFIVSGSLPDGWTRLISSENSAVWKFPVNDRWLVFKDYLKRRDLDTVKSLFTGSRAKKAWQNGKELLLRGFNSPKVFIFGEQSFMFLPVRSFLVMEFLKDSLGLHTILIDFFRTPLTSEKIKLKRSLLRSTGRFIGTLHSKGIFHGDLRLDNIIVSGWETGEHRFYLIDNERNKYFSKKIKSTLREKNLVQINMVILSQITFTDRLRFFKSYLNENPELIPVEKELTRKVFLQTKKRLSKKFPGIWEKHGAQD